jgi:hypothetical protein
MEKTLFIKRIITACLVLFCLIPGLHAEDNLSDRVLALEFWCELDPFVREADIYPLSKDEVSRRVLEEARFVFSGMIYGFTFSYTPLDRARGIEEEFSLVPQAEIPSGDPSLAVIDTRTTDERFFADLRYSVRLFQERWMRGWESSVLPVVSGIGTGRVSEGHTAKLVSYREAVKEAARGYLRQRLQNKPKEVRGEVILVSSTYCVVDAGAYTSRAQIKIRISEIVPYRIY